ncbi:MAG: SRPBCC family protein [Betaproteobacteria bacterium]
MTGLVIGAVAVLAIAALLVYAATRPDTFRIQRSIRIQAPPEKIFTFLVDFRRWGAWSPWEGRDPAMKRSLSGAQTGKGSVYEWSGNSKVGQGRMEIVEAAAPSTLRVKLDFLKPFEAHNVAEFVLSPAGGSTDVTWAMYGPSPFMSKLIGVFMNMDRMVGRDFEAGLGSLKAASEN